ncbi:LytTR family DNA-binding domain-containing protein [Parapedobacter koreensis]|uniref:LytTr DNA-binding domain-containing protein n=1 Tax=Parapedobacter koreensis TaxID=332977 RepID=A0A1H7Q1P9_9SPHI|nr:LytTR family DNA-binding domain-containing protein [Parapedobacter koreensis]SEL41634.1 LytTr DNA-binding domain-containing protein [Parapedobacter koreensis]
MKKIYRIIDLTLKVALAIWAGYLALAFGEPEGFRQLQALEGFYPLWAVNTIICLVLLLVIQLGESRIGARVPRKRWALRILLQAVACLLCPIALAYLAARWYFSFFAIAMEDTSYFDDVFILSIIFIIFGNAYQLIWRLLVVNHAQRLMLADKEENGKPSEKMKIHARLAKQHVSLHEEDCAYFRRDGKDLIVVTMDNRKYYIHDDPAIKDWEPKLSGELFCRINAGCIVNRNAIDKSVKHGARSYHLQLKPPLEETLTVSQGYFNAYKTWMGL